MKKMKLGMITFLSILGFILIIVSCEKEAGIEQTYTPIVGSSEFLPDHDEVIPLIKKFKAIHAEYMEGLKAYSDMPLEQALWTLEASVNYDFASENDSTTDFVYDTIIVYVDSYYENDTVKVDGESLLEAYDDLYDFVYSQITDSSYSQLIAGDVSITDTTTTTTTFMMVTVIGPLVTGNYGINSSDYWYAAMGEGKCDSFIGQNEGRDAADRLHQVLNWNHGMSLACGNGQIFYTSIDSYTIRKENGEFIFWNGDYDECLAPANLTYWQSVAESEIDAKCTDGHVFIDVEFEDDFEYSSSTFHHVMQQLQVGIPYCVVNN